MPAGPRTTPFPVVVQFSDSTNPLIPVKLLESSSLFVQSLSGTSISATTYYNLPTLGGEVTSIYQLASTGILELTSYSRNNFATTGQLQSYVLTSTNNNLSSLVSNLQTSTAGLSSTLGSHLTSAVHWTRSQLDSDYLNSSGDTANAGFYLSSVSSVNISATNISAVNYFNLPSFATTANNVTSFAGTGVFETTAYARNNYATTGQLASYALTASLGAYETTSFARNNYVLTSTNAGLSSSYDAHLASSVVHFTAGSLTSTYETTGYARNTYATTGQLASYALTASLAGYETTSYARNNYLVTSVNVTALNGTGVFETTGYARNTYATTASLVAYETTGYARNNYVLTSTNNALSASYAAHLASATVHFTAASLTSTYETTGYARNTYATTAQLGGYETTAYARNNYVLTSTNSNLSSTVSNHLASAVHWDLDTLNNYYINASGDSVTGTFRFGIVSATTISATNFSGASLSGSLRDVSITSTPPTGYVLKWNGSRWAPAFDATGTGGAGEPTPAGNTGDVQYNAGGVLGGVTVFNYDDVAQKLIVPNFSATNISATTYYNLPSVTALNGTSVFETTGYARNTYATTAQLSNYALTGSLAAYETTAYARNNYVLTSTNSALSSSYDNHLASSIVHFTAASLTSTYETTGYARNTYATTAQLAGYETTAYARNNYLLTSVNVTALNGTGVFETTGYARNTYATTASLAAYETTGYARNNYVLTSTNSALSSSYNAHLASASVHFTAASLTSIYETTGYARNTYATTGQLGSYVLTSVNDGLSSSYNSHLASSIVHFTAASLTSTYETTGYARNTYATTAQLASYALTASLGAYETTAYARNNYLLTSVNVTALNGTGVFETTGYARNTYATTASLGAYETTAYARNTYETTSFARNNYVLTSVNSNLSSTVSNHLASAVHWQLSTLNNFYVNASGDSVTGSFYFQNLSAAVVSSTRVSAVELYPASSAKRNWVFYGDPQNGKITQNGEFWFSSNAFVPGVPTNPSSTLFVPRLAVGGVQGADVSKKMGILLGYFSGNIGAAPEEATDNEPPIFIAFSAPINSLVFLDGSGQFESTSSITISTDQAPNDTLNAGSLSAEFVYVNSNVYANDISATFYQNLPSFATTATNVTSFAGTGVFETTAYARNNYSLTSHNHSFSALSGLSDVQVTSTPTTNYVLKWNGTKWAPAVDSTGGGGISNSFAVIEDEAANPIAATGEDTVRFVSRDNAILISVDSGTTPQEVNFEVDESAVVHNDLFGLTTGNPHTQYATLSGATFSGQVRAPSISATDYYNLPSGTAIWNASQLEGVDVTSTTPTTGQALVYNGTVWQPSSLPTGGAGSTSPGGSNTEVQFNNNGSFSGTSALTYTQSTETLFAKTISSTNYQNTWNVVEKLTDQNYSSNTAQGDNHLRFTMEANSKYLIRASVFFSGTTTTADIRYGFSGPASPTLVRMARHGQVANGAAFAVLVVATAYDATGAATTTAATGPGVLHYNGTVQNGANAGTFSLLFAAGAASQNNVVYTGSYLEYLKF